MEITYDTGAKVILQGPVTYEVQSKDGGYLSLGKLTARVEDEGRESASSWAATLTLLGLIIGFSFSMATSRYDQRRNYEEAEANAIGTGYVRADPCLSLMRRPYTSCCGTTSISVSCSTWLAMDRASRSTPVPLSCRPSCGPRIMLRPRRSRTP